MEYPVPEHPDPDWISRLEDVKAATHLDICALCGHIRQLHDWIGSCRAYSRALVGDPGPCDCTNRAGGSIYKDGRTLRQVTPP